MVHCWRTIKLEEGTRALYSGLAPALLRQAVYGTIKYGLYYTIKDLTASGGEESPLKNVSIAVIAGSVSAAIATPTDVLKVRLQSRSAPVVSPKKTIRVSLYNCFNDIYRREGVAGLWRGAVPTASRAALVAGVQLPVYDMCKHFMLSNDFLPGNIFNLYVSEAEIDVFWRACVFKRTRFDECRKIYSRMFYSNTVYSEVFLYQGVFIKVHLL